MSHASLAALAVRMIAANGREMVLREMVESGTAYNPTLTPVDTPVVGVVETYKLQEIGGLVQQGDKRVLLSAEVVPKPEMKLVDGSTEYEIIDVGEVKPGDVSILFALQIRR